MHDLLRAATAGDERARSELVAMHAPRLQRYIERRSGARLLRETSTSDMVQETFLRLFSALRAMPGDATLDTFRRWMFRHADWVLQNHGRAAARHRGESVAETPPPGLAATSPATGAVTAADEAAWLRSLLQRLPARYGDVVRLRLEGLSFAAIGAQLGVDEAAARQRFARVLQTLRQHGPQQG